MNNKKERFASIKAAVERGANIRINENKDDLGKLAKDSIKISPLYLPRMRFWNAPDVKTQYRSLCRLILRLWKRDEPRYLNFDDICHANKIGESGLSRIERKLLISASVGFAFMLIAVLCAIYLNTLSGWLSGLGAFFLSGVIWWKYSFLLWQVRLRSLDKDKASVQSFMKTDWYTEIFK